MNNTSLQELIRALELAARNGERTTALGARLYGHVPHVAPEAWFHCLYRGLSDDRISQLEVELGREVPAPFVAFLRYSNGINLFSGRLALYGARNNYERTGDNAWQPFDLEAPNLIERPLGCPLSYFFIGGYGDDGSRLLIDSATMKVLRVPRRSFGPVLTAWSDFDDMLEREIRRLSGLFDTNGRLVVPGVPTTP